LLIDIKSKSQVTIPAPLIKKLNLKTGDKLDVQEVDGKLLFTPVLMIPKDQVWFYSEQWQAEEAQVEREKREGKLHEMGSKEALFDDLGLDK